MGDARQAARRIVAAAVLLAVWHQLWPAPAGVIAQGILVGGIGSLLALGLALVYRANRIVNFAQAELGGVPATLAVLLMQGSGWSFWPATLLGLGAAVVVGMVVERVFVRRFSKAPRLILTVVTIGVSQIFIALTAVLPQLILGNNFRLEPPKSPLTTEFRIDPILFRGSDVFAFITVPIVVLALFAFLRYTSVGIAIRASSENAERAALLGVPVARVQTTVWAVAAALSFWGVMLRAGSIGALGLFGVGSGPVLLTRALAACVIGRMERFGTILAASVGLGVLEQSIIWNTGRSTDATVVQFVVLLGALLLHRRATGRESGDASSWSSASGSRPVPAVLARLPEVVWGTRAFYTVLVGGVLLAPLVLNSGKTSLAALVLVYALLGLSLVVLTGWAGQVSLGQAAFFGFGGAVGSALTLRNWDPGMALLLAGLAGAAIATAVGLPALRIKGLYLAVTTLAFSVFASTYLINPDTVHWVPKSSQFIGRRPFFGRIDISSEKSYYYLCAACLFIGLFMVRGLRNSRTGRALMGIRDNERAAQSFGINATRTKLTAFALSGFLAAVAGVLYTHSQQALSTTRFGPAESLRVFTMVVIGGMGSIPGAVIGSLYLNGTAWFVDLINTDWIRTLVSFLGTGLGVIVILMILPGGLGELAYRVRDALLRFVARRRDIAVSSLIADTGTFDRPADAAAVDLLEEADDDDATLVVRGLEAGYDGVQVLFGVDLTVHPGEIVALLGTNGAGKSTALRGITGLTTATRGSVRFDGRDLTRLAPHKIAALGVAQVPGGRGIFPSLTVMENLRLATWLKRRDRDAVKRAIDDAFDWFPALRPHAHTAAGDLSGGQQQMLTLAQAFITRPRLIMIDELSLGLAPKLVEELVDAVKRMRDAGTTIILVEQSVNVALTVANRAYFMEKGEVRFQGPTRELLDHPEILRSVFIEGVIDASSGGNGSVNAKARPVSSAPVLGDVVLEVDAVSRSFGGIQAVSEVSLTLRDGEILGIIGPNGAGKTTLFDLISGFTAADSGSVCIEGFDVSNFGPDVRARAGLGRSFQDARLFPGLTVTETIALSLERYVEVKDPLAAALHMPGVTYSERAIATRVDELVALLGLEAYRDKFIAELSTGTRRIVDLACVLASRPRVLMFDEPSSGIAQRETEALGPLIRQIHEQTGAAILVIEHDMPLISSVSDELIAMDLGKVVLRGDPHTVLHDPRVIETYLGTQQDLVNRSGNTVTRRRREPLKAAGRR